MLLDSHGKEVEIGTLKNKNVIMYGASTRNQGAINELQIKDNVLFFIDSNEQRCGQVLNGYQIYSIEELKKHKECIILSVLVSHSKEVLEVLSENGIENCLFYYPNYFNIPEVYNSNNLVIQNRRNYQYIHIYSNDKFVVPFYQMLEERFCIEEHLVILAYRIKDDFAGILPFILEKNEKYRNIIILDDVHGITYKERLIPPELDCNQVFYSAYMKEICNHVKKIFLHSAFWGHETKKLVYDLTQVYHQKMIWGCFGGDAYFERDSFEVSEILSKIGRCTASAEMLEVIKINYGISAEADRAHYVYISNQAVHKEVSEHDSINILLGHSAFEYGNHIEGLELLYKYSNQDIKIFCPLSYGSVPYREQVIQKGKTLYGKKFIPILDYMEPDAYVQFLKTIDVAVFPLERLAGESTLLMLNAVSAKIYINVELIKDMKNEYIEAEDIKKIKEQSFEEFVTHAQMQQDIDKLNDDMVAEWRKLLES